jgi:hypothetical protein
MVVALHEPPLRDILSGLQRTKSRVSYCLTDPALLDIKPEVLNNSKAPESGWQPCGTIRRSGDRYSASEYVESSSGCGFVVHGWVKLLRQILPGHWD